MTTFKPISARLDISFFSDIHKFPINTNPKVKARLKNNKVQMKAVNKHGEWLDISQVEMVRIDWGFVSNSGNEVTQHELVMDVLNRVVLDELGNIVDVIPNQEAFIRIQTEFGLELLLPLFDTELYKRVTALKFRK